MRATDGYIQSNGVYRLFQNYNLPVYKLPSFHHTVWQGAAEQAGRN